MIEMMSSVFRISLYKYDIIMGKIYNLNLGDWKKLYCC